MAIYTYGDNQGAIFIARNVMQESHTKHIDIWYHYIRELINAKQVELMFVPGEMNPANIYQEFDVSQIHTIPKLDGAGF